MATVLSCALFACNNGEIGYSGKDLSGKVSITRDSRTKAASALVDLDSEWKFFAGPTVDDINMKNKILSGNKEGEFALPVNNSARSYFEFVNGNDRMIIAERRLPMEGGYNFRDLGGYRMADGRYVKWGMILRSDDLHNLTGSDLAYLASIPVNTIVDFRSEAEIREAPDQLPSPATARYELSIEPGSLNDVGEFASLTTEHIATFMEDMNIMFVSNPAFIGRYREFFRLLQEDGNAPLMFHCSAGKDRTGMGAALVLYALGADDETVMKDYIASNEYLGDKYADIVKQYPALEPLMTVRPEYLQAGIDRIREDHGSVDNFLRSALGVDIEKFREKYLY